MNAPPFLVRRSRSPSSRPPAGIGRGRGGGRRRFAAAALLAVVATFAGASPVEAHAGLVAASPEPATGLSQAPGAVVLRFSEPLNLGLSSITVTGPGGRDATTGPTQGVEGDARAMRRKLGLLRPGQYRVSWTSVSTVDGHTLHGAYGFAVGTEVGAGERVDSNPLASEGALGLLGRLVALIGLTLWAGWAIGRRAGQRAGLSPERNARLARVAPALVLVGTAASVASTAIVAHRPLAGVPALLSSPGAGAWRAVLLGAAAVGAVAGARLLVLALPAAALAVVAEGASGHAAASPWPAGATVALAVHLTAVGVWLYALAASLMARPRGRALAVFTPLAVTAAGLVAATGIGNAAFELANPGEVFSSGYGRVVAAKVAALVVMVALGLVHFRRRSDPAAPDAVLTPPLRAEAAAALVALVLTTVLVGFPNPPREASAAERLEGTDPALAQLGGKDAVSVGEASGPFVVGLTVLPPEPGPVSIRLQVLGVEPGDGLRDARVVATSAASTVPLDAPLRPCGTGCFEGRGTIAAQGTWRFAASLTSNRGPISVASELPMPAASGDALFAGAVSTMQRLNSVQMEERLQGSIDGPVISSSYQFHAPDALAFSVRDFSQITIGATTYSREKPSDPWSVGDTISLQWPATSFSVFWGKGVAARVIGNDVVDGVRTEVVSFLRPDLPAWFRIWIGRDDGLVRRELMVAEGHIMDHHYSAFNAAGEIRPPL